MEKLKVALCSLNSKFIHSSLSTWYLAAAIDDHCNAQVIEGTINEPLENVSERIVSCNPDLIGFSCYIWNITAIKKLIPLVKSKLPNTIIVLGGPEVSYNAKAVLSAEPMVAYIISGEGEKPFAMLVSLKAEQSPVSLCDIPGLCYRDGNDIKISPPHISSAEPKPPYSDNYFSSLNGRIAYIESSRGCPYSCAFCLSGACGEARCFDLERVKRNMLLLAHSGTKTVKFVDRTFNANKKRAYELFEFIIENYNKSIPNSVCFHFEIAADILNDKTIELLGTAPPGAIQLEIGIQSFNAKTLDAVQRKSNIDTLKRSITRLIGSGNIHIHIDLIAGLPFEDINSIAVGFNTAYSLKPHMLQLGFLKLLHGARMRDPMYEYPCEYSPEPPYTVIETSWLPRGELLSLQHTEDALDRLYNSGRFKRTLDYILEKNRAAPFELFTSFGEFCAAKDISGIPLEKYIGLVYSYFSRRGIDAVVLRDMLACDYISTNSSGKLPAALKIYDARYKNALRMLEENPKTRSTEGVKRGVVLLYSENSIAYSDYVNRNPVTREFALRKVPLSNV